MHDALFYTEPCVTLVNIYDAKFYSQLWVTLSYLERWHIQNPGYIQNTDKHENLKTSITKYFSQNVV